MLLSSVSLGSALSSPEPDMVESALLSLNGEAPILSAGAALYGDNAPPMSPPTALMSVMTLPGLLGVSAGGGAIST